MQNATYSPYNFSDYGNNDMTMQQQNELKPPIHMDIPAGEKNSGLDAIFEFFLNSFYANFRHYHSLRNVTFFSPAVEVAARNKNEKR